MNIVTDVVSYIYLIGITFDRTGIRNHVYDKAFIAWTDYLHNTSLAGSHLNGDKTGRLKLADMH